MINMDMIGRLRDSKVYIGGVGSGSNLKATVEEVLPKHHLNIDFSDSTGYGSSDHTSFTAKQVPVLFFFSGLHADYHRPGDTWEKIDAPGTVKLLALISDIADQLRAEARRPQFVRVNETTRTAARQDRRAQVADRAMALISEAFRISPNSPTACVSPTCGRGRRRARPG